MADKGVDKAAFLAEAAAMYDELSAWRTAHGEASFDEIAEQVRAKRQAVMGGLLARLATQNGAGEWLSERTCPECGGVLHYKGKKRRTVLHAEGNAVLARGYHHCDQCGHGFFPSGPDVTLGEPRVDAADGGASGAVSDGNCVV
jgi:hypothetical protein